MTENQYLAKAEKLCREYVRAINSQREAARQIKDLADTAASLDTPMSKALLQFDEQTDQEDFAEDYHPLFDTLLQQVHLRDSRDEVIELAYEGPLKPLDEDRFVAKAMRALQVS